MSWRARRSIGSTRIGSRVEAGDYMWLRAFCPQACYAGGPGPFRYLLYKDVNRHMALAAPGARASGGAGLMAAAE